jgi:hypothetical protein
MQVYLHRDIGGDYNLNQDREWIFELPDNTKLSKLLEYFSLNTNLGNLKDTVWAIKENTDNFRKALGFVLVDSKSRIRTVLNDFKNDLSISEIPSELKAVKVNDGKYWTFTFGTKEYKQMLDYLREDIPHFKINTQDCDLIADGVLLGIQEIGDYRYIYVIGVANQTEYNSYTFGQISSLDYEYLCNNDDLPRDTYIKYAKKRILYSEGGSIDYFTEEVLSRFMIYRRSKWGELKAY